MNQLSSLQGVLTWAMTAFRMSLQLAGLSDPVSLVKGTSHHKAAGVDP